MMAVRGTSEADYQRDADRMATVMENVVRRFIMESPPLKKLEQQARALFPSHQTAAGTIVFEPSVIHRLDKLEKTVGQLAVALANAPTDGPAHPPLHEHVWTVLYGKSNAEEVTFVCDHPRVACTETRTVPNRFSGVSLGIH